MFFAFRRRPVCQPAQICFARILCVEADSIPHAVERAKYFGIDFNRRPTCGCCYPEFQRPGPLARLTDRPTYSELALGYWEKNWVVLYKDGRMTHSLANLDDLIREP